MTLLAHLDVDPSGDSALTPIDVVARRLGINASTIRYYDQRGLVTPASRHAGRRWYDETGVRDLAVIRYWQNVGLMSLDDIAEIMNGQRRQREWRVLVSDHIEALETKAAELRSAAALLAHILDHHPHDAPDGCVHYESLIWGHDPTN